MDTKIIQGLKDKFQHTELLLHSSVCTAKHVSWWFQIGILSVTGFAL